MYSLIRFRSLVWLMWLLPTLGACQPTANAPQPPTAAARLATGATFLPPAAAATAPPVATVALPATPSPTPSITPTNTPTPQPLTIAFPAVWSEAVAAAAAQAAAQMPQRAWLLQADNPAADIRLTADDQVQGLPIGREPLALAVPFTHAWSDKTWAEAQGLHLPECAVAAAGDPCWLPWRDLRPPLKAVRLDGRLPFAAEYPAQRQWSLIGNEPDAMALLAAHLTPRLASWLAPTPLVSLAAVGDLMLDRSLGYRLTLGDLDVPFISVLAELQTADLTIGNLESSLGDIGEPAAKSYPFQAPPVAAVSLARAGFDVVSLANNHAMDYGAAALQQGIGLLQAQGIGVVGAGDNRATAHAPLILSCHGLRLAFLGYVNVPVEWNGFDTRSWAATDNTPGLAWGEPAVIAADVTAARQQADLVIVMLHSGYEYQVQPSEPQRAAAQAAIQAGAQLVIGHHAHVLQGVQFLPAGVIAYGLGNFAFEIDGPPETVILRVWLDGQGVKMLEFVPAIVQFGGAPRLATPEEAQTIRQQLYTLTNQLNP
ncbi:MAG: hypothetical protein Fur0021_38990 [Candidatus Promineifilaceae bacterium]